MKFFLPKPLTALVVCLLLAGLAAAEPLRWQAALAADQGHLQERSEFVAVEAQAAIEGVQPARAFVAGHVEQGATFEFGGLEQLGGGDELAVVVRLSDHGGSGWAGDWQAWVSSAGGVEIADIAFSEQDAVTYVCGRFTGSGSFTSSGSPGAWNLAGPVGENGFVAAIDGETGHWTAAVRLPNLLPESIAVDRAGNLYLTGSDKLVVKYTAALTPVWSVAAPTGTTELVEVAASPGPDNEHVYVLSKDGGDASGQEVVLTQVVRETGVVGWTRRMGGDGDDHAGGIDVRGNGYVGVTYSSEGTRPLFNGVPVDGVPEVEACHAMVATLREDGVAKWVVPLGNPQSGASLRTSGLSIDSKGNAWLCAEVDGMWSFLGAADAEFSEDMLLLSVDSMGKPVQQLPNIDYGEIAAPAAISVASSDMVMVVGAYRSGTLEFKDLPYWLPHTKEDSAFLAVARVPDDQQLVVIRGDWKSDDEVNLWLIERELAWLGVSAYTVVENGPLGSSVSAWLLPNEIEELQWEGKLIIEPEVMLDTSGAVANSGWALARLGDAAAQAPWIYSYPETSNEVVLYLVDTAVANPAGWFDANPNLSIEESILIRGAGDPEESSEFGHGTRMLSLIAGPETGAAQGTPIRLVNYDIYPDGATTTASLVAKAILEAARRHQQEPAGTRGVICLATSSQTKGASMTLEMAVDYAVNAGLPVVVSAGNSGEDASAYIPASYGADGGVICVGASNAYNQRTAISNFGSAVDLYAPGENVNVIRFDAPASGVCDLSNGTSPATALTAAAALVELSQEPSWQPEEVEKVMIDSAVPVPTLSIAALSPTVANLIVASDDFSSGGFSGGSGWLGNWGASGTVTVPDGHMNLAFAGTSATRAVDLSSYSSAWLRFHMQTFDNGNDTWVVEANDGSGWVTVDTIAPAGSGTVVERNEQRTYQLENHISLTSTVQVRFRITQGYGQTGIQFVNLDDIVIYSSTGGSSGAVRLVQMGPYGGGGTQTEFEQWATAQGLPTLDPTADSDGDGTVNLLEFIQGSDPNAVEEPAQAVSYTSDGDAIGYEFEVDPKLLDATNTKTLLDGTSWEIQCSDDMINWHPVSNEVSYSSTPEGRVLISVDLHPETPQCFVRIVLTPAG